MNNYFADFKIDDFLLECFGVKLFKLFDDQFEIQYPYPDGTLKICKPFVMKKEYKWKTIKSKNEILNGNIFGYDRLPKSGNEVIITGGEKDVLSFTAYGYAAVSVNSETSGIPIEIIEELESRFKHILICYDLDNTGRRNSLKFQKLYNLVNVTLPNDFEGKDISDFRKAGRSKKELDKLLEETIYKSIFLKPYIKYKELAQLSIPPVEYLLEGFIPKANLIGIMGGSEGGKTLLMLQFSICYILNKDFLGFKMNGGKKVLFLTFEDDKKAIHYRMQRMLANLTDAQRELVYQSFFIIDRYEDSEKLIENHLLSHPDTGLIVVDTLSEWLSNSDLNSAGQVRGEIQRLTLFANQYDSSIVYIHHITKKAEEGNRFSKINSLGSQAIEARARVLLEVKKSEIRGTVELAIVKGNDIPDEMKYPYKTLVTKLNTENLWFEYQMTIGPLSVGLPVNSLKVSWEEIFKEKEEMKTAEILENLQSTYNITKRKAEKIIGDELGEFRIEKGLYKNPGHGTAKQG